MCHVLTEEELRDDREEGLQTVLKRLNASVNGLNVDDFPLGQCCISICVCVCVCVGGERTRRGTEKANVSVC